MNFKICIFFTILLCLTFIGFSQNSVWNNNSFKITKDTSALEDMTGAIAISFNNGPIYSSASIPFGGFSFRYGLSAFNNFYVSPYGFIKLGSQINNNNPTLDTSIISALYNETSWSASYKLVGNSPNRKIVIHFAGVMQPSGEPTSYQIWLNERTGKIQLVYEEVRGFYGFSDIWKYKIFCSANIMNQSVIASIKINSNNSNPSINYAFPSLSFDSIYPNTRFTFQPDTIKPIIPSTLNFTNVQAGCMTVNVTENSTNESLVTIERADSGTNYFVEKRYYVSSPLGGSSYSYVPTYIQPFWNYSYRTFASNGFLNSDTVFNTIQTPMPQISGIKSVPGDYPTITALLLDAVCKHMGPNLIIELQSNYNFASETLPLTFQSVLQNRLIQSIVIRPALNTTINWTAFTNTALFYVDSVKHVFLDGRPGGVGTSQNLIIQQQNPQITAIQYTNMADSGGINYCKILNKNSNSTISAAVLIIPWNSTSSFPKKALNGFSLTNNFISVDSGSTTRLVYVKTLDTSNYKNFVISGNQFSRFRTDAIYFENGGENLQISNNKFFQPIAITPEAYLPINNSSCIKLINTEIANIDNNYFGGSNINWGTGRFIINANSNRDLNFIHYQNTSKIKKLVIRNNKFGNIYASSSVGQGSFIKMIYAHGGDVLIDNNQFGTLDSINSITANSNFWGIHLLFGTKTITNNFFSGFQAQHPVAADNIASYFITSSNTDSTLVYNNDIGGSNNIAANSARGTIYVYQGLQSEKRITFQKNKLRGIRSTNNSVYGVCTFENSITNYTVERLKVDSNEIHHIEAAAKVGGISLLLNMRLTPIISNNIIYGLRTRGAMLNEFQQQPSVGGIGVKDFNLENPNLIQGEIQIFGNKIHSFESLKENPSYTAFLYGITVSGSVSKIWNNEIRLGISMKGLNVDSTAGLKGIAVASINYQQHAPNKHIVDHNTIFIGGVGVPGVAIASGNSQNYVDATTLIFTNNILNMERTTNGSFISSAIFQQMDGVKIQSAKNLWYSSAIQNVPTLLQNFKQTCGCDSSSFVGNPVFINPTGDSSNYNLHLGPLSRADSSGTPSVLNIQTDLDNKNRNAFSPVDIGCYAATPCGTGIFPVLILSPSLDSLQLCSGGTITLSATITGGAFQQLQWQRNLIDSVGANANTLLVSQPGSYRIVGKTACGRVASKIIHIVDYDLQKLVTITSTSNNVCQGTSITFTASTINCGNNPIYQWKVNGTNVGTNSSTFTSNSLNNNDTVKVIVIANICGATSNVISNIRIIIVNSISSPTINITCNSLWTCTSCIAS